MQTEKEYTVAREISSLRCESVGEYSLPDYNGDVKKVLLVKADVYPAGKFVGDDTLEFSGAVGYEIVYVDGENNITHAEFSTDYDAAVRVNSENYLDSDIKTSVLSCNMRLIGPRKLSVKCSLDNTVRISEKRVYSIDGDAFLNYEPEFISESASIFTSEFGTGEMREINEEILAVDGAIADEIEVLLTDITPCVDVVNKTGGTAELKGVLRVNALYRNGESELKTTEAEIGFSEEVALDTAYEFDDLDVRVDMANKKVSVVPTEDGVSVTLSLNATPKIYGRKNSSFELVADSYLKERGSENEHSDFGYIEYACTSNDEVSFEYRSELGEGDLSGDFEIIYTDAFAKVEECDFADNSVKILGEIKFNAIACQVSEEGVRTYTPIKITAPFSNNVNINCQKWGNMHTDCSVCARDAKMNVANGEVVATCDLAFAVNVYFDRSKRALVASYVTEEEYSHDDSLVSVYYPDASESLFGIAKKFHTSVGAIASANRLSESVFASSCEPINDVGVRKLLIK